MSPRLISSLTQMLQIQIHLLTELGKWTLRKSTKIEDRNVDHGAEDCGHLLRISVMRRLSSRRDLCLLAYLLPRLDPICGAEVKIL